MILTVSGNLIEINTTRTHGSKSARCSPSSENCSFTLETPEVGNTRRVATTSVKKSGDEIILNSAVFSYEAPGLSSLTWPESDWTLGHGGGCTPVVR